MKGRNLSIKPMIAPSVFLDHCPALLRVVRVPEERKNIAV